ncbi:alpha/beta fold hydrolase [Brevibacillus dissolubilis]|uniref:alpha/beta fold hydrolase n=1 Tax=Brevibacillus dissolubilis TaxID=1844116 RepID=UPI00159B8A2B|nr:alpha/beta fold hydrolase [Brevibacillus dissolubilis]
MSTYVLVHGAFHGAWCWQKVVPLLEAAGHQVIAVDLPSHGEDQTPPSEVTLKDYTNRVCSVLDEQTEKVILVGHSFGGLVISQVAEYRPDKIQTLVYLAAILPMNNQNMMVISEAYQMSPLPLLFSPDMTYAHLDQTCVTEHFYGECTEADATEAKSRLGHQPLAPFMAPVSLTEERFDSVPRMYIETTKDNSLTVEVQRQMQSHTPCQQVFTMDTDHSPFLSQPELLVSNLESVAQKVAP